MMLTFVINAGAEEAKPEATPEAEPEVKAEAKPAMSPEDIKEFTQRNQRLPRPEHLSAGRVYI